MRPSEARFAQVLELLAAFVESRYGVRVRFADVPEPFSGDLDGAEIRLGRQLGFEAAVFTLAHLFGHTVQWNLSAEARSLAAPAAGQPSEELLAALEPYEREACRYSLALLHAAGVRDLDAWLSDYSAADLSYIMHFYRTRERRPLSAHWRDGEPLLEPLAIPPFRAHRWKARWEGVVL